MNPSVKMYSLLTTFFEQLTYTESLKVVHSAQYSSYTWQSLLTKDYFKLAVQKTSERNVKKFFKNAR